VAILSELVLDGTAGSCGTEGGLSSTGEGQKPDMPPCKATFREVGAVTIIDMSGLLMLGDSCAVLRQAIRESIDQKRSKVILNLRGVTAIDSAGVAELVAAYTAMKSRDGRLKLLNPPKKICDMLELTQLSKVLDVFTEEESALRSFA
jgi:anti-sigma B factor antagonist